jgi:type II secretion system protein I
MTHPRRTHRRRGLSLLEVLVALAIFLLAVVAIGRLIILGGENALEVQMQSEAALICQSQMNKVTAGVVPLSSQAEVPLDEDPAWLWSLDAEQGTVPGLWTVTVRVLRQRPDGTTGEYSSLSAMLLDPSLRGSNQDTVTISGSESTGGGTGGTSQSGGTSQPSQGGAAGAGVAPAGGAGGVGGMSRPAGGGGIMPSGGGGAAPAGGAGFGGGRPTGGGASPAPAGGGRPAGGGFRGGN